MMHPGIDVTVAAVIRQDDRYLMVEEVVGGKTVFNQPAGHVEIGETLEQAVIREVLEETGYRFTPHSLLGIFTWTGENRSFLRIAFNGDAEPPRGPCSLDDGIIATHWLTMAELTQRHALLRSPMVMSCVEQADIGVEMPLSVIRTLSSALEKALSIAEA